MPVYQAALQIHTVGHAGIVGVNTLGRVCILEKRCRVREIDLDFGSDFENLGKMIQPIAALLTGSHI